MSLINKQKEYWGPEFAGICNVQHSPEHNEIAAMGAYTLAYHIADTFRDGAHREEILRLVGIEPVKPPPNQ